MLDKKYKKTTNIIAGYFFSIFKIIFEDSPSSPLRKVEISKKFLNIGDFDGRESKNTHFEGN